MSVKRIGGKLLTQNVNSEVILLGKIKKVRNYLLFTYSYSLPRITYYCFIHIIVSQLYVKINMVMFFFISFD